MASAQQRLQAGISELKTVQKDLQKKVETRQTLDAQLSENKIVKDELELVKGDSKVYKLIGPTLVRQDIGEAKATVSKRIEYISAELKRLDAMIKELETKQEKCQSNLQAMQQEFQAANQQQQAQAVA